MNSKNKNQIFSSIQLDLFSGQEEHLVKQPKSLTRNQILQNLISLTRILKAKNSLQQELNRRRRFQYNFDEEKFNPKDLIMGPDPILYNGKLYSTPSNLLLIK